MAFGIHDFNLSPFLYFNYIGKICDNPLLYNESIFPDSVFSGYGNGRNSPIKYKDARITNGGWCPTQYNFAYLYIDLKKEYHITQILVMTDKEQKEFSGLHYLKYGREYPNGLEKIDKV
jgi:hypothetical protein